MVEGAPRVTESAASYKRRLRDTAMRIPKKIIRDAIARIKPKAEEVVAAGGGKIASD